MVIADLEQARPEAAAAEDRQPQRAARYSELAMDVTDEDAVESRSGNEPFRNMAASISCAAMQVTRSSAAFTSWRIAIGRKYMAVHLDGAFLTTRACLRHMYHSGQGGCILYTGSVHSKLASVLKAPYVTAKHGMLGLCRAVAKEGAPYGVRANVICPGFVRTPLVEKQIPEQAKILNIDPQEVVEKVMLKDTVDQQFTSMDEIGATAVFLAEQTTLALTGQSIMVTHGWFME